MADSTLVLAQLTIDDLPPGVPASGVSIELRAAAAGDEGAEPSPRSRRRRSRWPTTPRR